MSGDGQNLPRGWREVEFSTLFREPLRNGHSARAAEDGRGIRTLTLSAVTYGDFSEVNTKITSASPDKVHGLWLEPGDVLIERSNTAELVGTARVYRGRRNYAIFPDLLIRARLVPEVSDKFIEHFLSSEEARTYFRRSAQGIAGSMPKISQGTIEKLRVPLAPKPEQMRIVAEIEKQFTRLDAGVEALRRLQAHLRRYRAAVLKAACEGRLVATEAAVARQEDRRYEPASETLRRAKEATRSGRRREPDPLPHLRALPDGWAWARASDFAEIQGGIQKQPSRAPKSNAYPFLRVANVLRGYLNLEEVHQVELFDGELERLRLMKGDLLIIEGNGSAGEIGRMAVWDGSIENCVHQNHIIRLRPKPGVLPNYVAAFWNSPEGRAGVATKASSTSGLFTLSVSKVGSLPIPVPPTAEQERIITRVEELLSFADRAAADVELALQRAARLRASVLRAAFSGTLLSQGPHSEPPEAMLARSVGESPKIVGRARSAS